MQLYQEELMDHYRNPRNKGGLEQASFASTEHNPSCGDTVKFEGFVSAGALKSIVFDGRGCVISQGVASMLTEICKNKGILEVLALDKEYIITHLGIPLGPTRLKCALLPLQALQQGIIEYQQGNG
ncbi:MAG: iron-sulfur cluster assembly scaffold protein [Candidatus Dependentiae bacterium]|nr:iron-sulfur cluster assembly scaffold protein [Candidatus Dependentiae bacterium]